MCFACSKLWNRNIDTNKTDGTNISNNTVQYGKTKAKHNLKRQKKNNLGKKLYEIFDINKRNKIGNELKCKWFGHFSRRQDNKWSKIIRHWYLRKVNHLSKMK